MTAFRLSLEDTPAPFVVAAYGKWLSSVPDGRTRALYLLRLVEDAPPLPLARVLACAQREAALGEANARVVIDVFGVCVDEGLLDDALREVLAQAAEDVDEFAVLGMLRGARPAPIPTPFTPKRLPKGSLAADGETLGRRKSLARIVRGDALDKILLDPHPDVIANAMMNPSLKEEQVVRLAARLDVDESILTTIARSRFQNRTEVRRALVKNPKCPATLGCRLLVTLTRVELLEIAHDTRIKDEVRDAARAMIDAKPPRLVKH